MATFRYLGLGAVISDCGRFRYRLWRRWGDGPALVFIMLNPSTADGAADDATIRRCVRFAAAHGYWAIEVVNLFAYRATKPADLRRAGWPVGPDNDFHTLDAVRRGGDVCFAWGANVDGLARPEEVMQLVRRAGIEPWCLSITRSGYPSHPLMLPAATQLRRFNIEAIQVAMEGEAHG